MKVLLVNPDYEIERYMGRHFGNMGWIMPPMGLLYLAAQLEREHIAVDVYDAQVDRRSLMTALVELAPDVVGITCASALVESTLTAARITKEHDPGITTVVGGVHPTIRPDDLFTTPDIDIAVRGEGHFTLVEIVRALEAGNDLSAIEGLSYRCGDEVAHNPPRPLADDVDDFPFPARHLVPMAEYRMSPDLSLRRPFDIIFGAYGCPWDCVFCAAQVVMGGSFRLRSIGNIMEEIDLVVSQGQVRSLLMGDDNFVVSKDRTLEFCDEYIRRGHHRLVPWQIATRVDSVDREILFALKKAGCYLVSFGIESAVSSTLETAEKGINTDQSEAAVRWAKEAGLKVRATFILGLPGETREQSLETIRFAKTIAIDQARFALATPYPGTRLWQIAQEEGSMEVDDWMALSSMGGYRQRDLVYVPRGRSSDELKKLQRQANFSFYFRPKVMLDFATRIRSLDDLGEYARGAWGLLQATMKPY